ARVQRTAASPQSDKSFRIFLVLSDLKNVEWRVGRTKLQTLCQCLVFRRLVGSRRAIRKDLPGWRAKSASVRLIQAIARTYTPAKSKLRYCVYANDCDVRGDHAEARAAGLRALPANTAVRRHLRWRRSQCRGGAGAIRPARGVRHGAPQ